MRKKLPGFLFITVFCFLVISCSKYSEPSVTIEEIVVDGSNVKEEHDISSLIDEISIVRLDESSDSFIGEAYKVLKTEDHYIILDKENAKRIVVFDNNGIFVKNVVDIGKGPGEAVQLNDLWLNNDNQLEVYDFSQKRVSIFNEYFDFVESIKSRESLIFSSMMKKSVRVTNPSLLPSLCGSNADYKYSSSSENVGCSKKTSAKTRLIEFT